MEERARESLNIEQIPLEVLIAIAVEQHRKVQEMLFGSPVDGLTPENPGPEVLEALEFFKLVMVELDRRGALPPELSHQLRDGVTSNTARPPRTPWRPPTWMTTRNIAKSLAGLGLLVALGFGARLLYDITRPAPPVFLNREAPATLAEMNKEPPSFIYGSSINFWVYTRDGEISELAVTGHADSSTCRQVTSLMFGTYLEKNEEPDDFFVAGAGWLSQHEDPKRRAELQRSPEVLQYVLTLINLGTAEQALRTWEDDHLSSDENQTALAQQQQRVVDLKAELEKAEDDPIISEYLRNSRSSEAFQSLVRETERIAKETGLARLHTLPAEVADKTRARVKEAALSGRAQTLEFRDLLEGTGASDAVVYMNVLRTDNGEPVELTIPVGELSVDAFEEAKRLNRSGLENAIIGDANRRREFYDLKEREMKDRLEFCKALSPSKLAEKVPLTESYNSEGVRIRPDTVEVITQGEYCGVRIPLNLKILQAWRKPVERQLELFDADASLPGGSRIERINHLTLIDSMLRDWALPVGDGQSAFDAWRQQRRGAVWVALYERMERLKLSPELLQGENVVFSVRMQGDMFVIRPIHVINLANTVVLVDPDRGGTVSIDTWSQRQVIAAPVVSDQQRTLQSEAIRQIDAAVQAAANGQIEQGRVALRKGLELEPRAAIGQLESKWKSLFPDTSGHQAALAERVRPLLTASDFFYAVQALEQRTAAKEDWFEYLAGLRALTLANPKAPTEYFFRTAYIASMIVAASHQRDGVSRTRGSPTEGEAVDPWNVLLALSQPGSSQERYLVGRQRASERLNEDPATIILDSISHARNDDPEWIQRVLASRQQPNEPSERLKQLQSDTEQGVSGFEEEALELERIKDLLHRRSAASLAELTLRMPDKEIDIDKVLTQLEPAVKEGATSGEALLQVGKQRLEEYASIQERPDTLTRHEIAAQLRLGGDMMLKRAHIGLDGALAQFQGLREHAVVTARLHFESGEYARAINALFPSQTAVALYHQALQWKPIEEVPVGPIDGIHAHVVDGVIHVQALRGERRLPILELSGLPETDANVLAGLINQVPAQAWRQDSRLSEQVLLLQVKPRAEVQAFRSLFEQESERLTLLKAMVYGCEPPGRDILPVGGRCLEEEVTRERFDRVTALKVTDIQFPSLDELKTAKGISVRSPPSR